VGPPDKIHNNAQTKIASHAEAATAAYRTGGIIHRDRKLARAILRHRSP